MGPAHPLDVALVAQQHGQVPEIALTRLRPVEVRA
jgi:hypothetical protein